MKRGTMKDITITHKMIKVAANVIDLWCETTRSEAIAEDALRAALLQVQFPQSS